MYRGADKNLISENIALISILAALFGTCLCDIITLSQSV